MFKGEFIFATTEKDRRSAAAFQVLLLDCMERWAKVMPFSEDGKTPSLFMKNYMSLQGKRIFFPSQCRKSNPFTELGMPEEA